MADHFLTKTRISLSDVIELDGTPAFDRYAELQALLLERAGPATAALFAEPLVSRGNDAAPPTVSWYVEADGDGRPLQSLDGPARAEAEAYLAAHLRPLRALLGDEGQGPLVGAALHVASPGDIWVVGGKPVIVNWGLHAPGSSRDQAARARDYAAGLGRFLPLGAAPPLVPGERLPEVAGAAPAAAATATPDAAAAPPGRAAPPPVPPAAPPVPDRGGRIPAIAWVPLVVLLLLAGATLAWLTLPGTRLFPPDIAGHAVRDDNALALAEEVNRNLQERRAALRAALDGAVCRPDGTLVLPGDRTIEGLLPPRPGVPEDAPGQRAEATPQGALPPDPNRVVVPDPGAGMPQSSLLALIEARTVMVLAAAEGRGLGVGTGFVVGPGLIVTNHHVIQSAAQGSLYVTSQALGSLREARVLKSLGPLETAGGDFALVQIDDTSLPAFTLHAPAGTLRLQNVVAAGYPGDVLETDAAFAALRSGDAGAVPGLTVTDGAINTEQQLSPVTNVLVHSAPISQGNSGGPLVDMCGRLVGVNTFVRQGPMRNLNFALAVPDLVDFLAGTTARPEVVSQACMPAVLRPAPPATVEAAAPEPPADPAPTLPVFE